MVCCNTFTTQTNGGIIRTKIGTVVSGMAGVVGGKVTGFTLTNSIEGPGVTARAEGRLVALFHLFTCFLSQRVCVNEVLMSKQS